MGGFEFGSGGCASGCLVEVETGCLEAQAPQGIVSTTFRSLKKRVWGPGLKSGRGAPQAHEKDKA